MNRDFWPDNVRVFVDMLGIEHPIIQAPMAGGPSTPELAAAVSNAGALGSLGAGYLSAEQLDAQIRRVKELTDSPFNVNLFVPEVQTASEISDEVIEKLDEMARELNVAPIEIPGLLNYSFEEQLAVVLDNNIPVFSFTFGIPEQGDIQRLKHKGVIVIGTATCVEEGAKLQEAGCSAVVAQGIEAGGHRGSFVSSNMIPMIGGMALVPQLASSTKIPLIASGGIMDGRGIAASLALGASAAQIGTAFLSCKEADLPKPWLDSLLNSKDTSTVLTKTFSGKYARGINNRFIEEMSSLEEEIPAYPLQNSLTRQIRNAAKDKGDSDYMSLWAGQGSSLSRQSTAKEMVDALVSETYTVIKALSSSL